MDRGDFFFPTPLPLVFFQILAVCPFLSLPTGYVRHWTDVKGEGEGANLTTRSAGSKLHREGTVQARPEGEGSSGQVGVDILGLIWHPSTYCRGAISGGREILFINLSTSSPLLKVYATWSPIVRHRQARAMTSSPAETFSGRSAVARQLLLLLVSKVTSVR